MHHKVPVHAPFRCAGSKQRWDRLDAKPLPHNMLTSTPKSSGLGPILAPPDLARQPLSRTIMMRKLTWGARTTALVTLLLSMGCGDSPTAPGIEPQIVNNTDSFSYQVSDLSRVTGSWDYTWQNTGTTAKVSHASDAGAEGSATLTIVDAAGVQVYSGPFAPTGEVLTSPTGSSGAWMLRVTYTDYTNTQVNFAVISQ